MLGFVFVLLLLLLLSSFLTVYDVTVCRGHDMHLYESNVDLKGQIGKLVHGVKSQSLRKNIQSVNQSLNTWVLYSRRLFQFVIPIHVCCAL